MDGINIFHIWHKVLGHTEKKKKSFSLPTYCKSQCSTYLVFKDKTNQGY